jgi:predicted dehydrogenase
MEENQDPLKVGILGTGFGSVVQYPGFLKHPGFDPIAIGGKHEAKTKKIASSKGIQNFHTNWRDLIKIEELDLISIVTPPHLHHEMSMAAFDAGKHVLCEKPLSTDLKTAEEMYTRSEDSGLIAMLDLVFRYIPSRAYLVELIKNGYLGEIYQIDITVHNDSRLNPRTRGYNWWSSSDHGGGVLKALGSHYIDFLLQACGEITEVSAKTATHIPKRLNKLTGKMKKVTSDDAFVALFNVGSEALASMKISSTTAYGRGPKIEAYGSEGALVMLEDQTLVGGKIGENDKLSRITIPKNLKLNLEMKDEHILVPPFMRLLDDLQKSVKSGRSLHPNFEDGMKIQKIIEGITKSSEDNTWIEIADL